MCLCRMIYSVKNLWTALFEIMDTREIFRYITLDMNYGSPSNSKSSWLFQYFMSKKAGKMGTIPIRFISREISELFACFMHHREFWAGPVTCVQLTCVLEFHFWWDISTGPRICMNDKRSTKRILKLCRLFHLPFGSEDHSIENFQVSFCIVFGYFCKLCIERSTCKFSRGRFVFYLDHFQISLPFFLTFLLYLHLFVVSCTKKRTQDDGGGLLVPGL